MANLARVPDRQANRQSVRVRRYTHGIRDKTKALHVLEERLARLDASEVGEQFVRHELATL
jgi:hypothetical protein